jgi:glycosyltransferase involved in cell wall biosynthesis
VGAERVHDADYRQLRALLHAEQPRPETVVILENGVDLDRFVGIPPVTARAVVEPHIGVVANLRPVKGLKEFVSAAARVSSRYPRARFAVAGEGEMREELERQVATEGLAGRFKLPGCVSDVPGFLADLDVAVLSSHAEGMSNAVLEYMAAGRPIVATAVGATPDLIADGVHGLLVPPRDAARLTDAIELLLDDRELAQRLGAAARRRALEHYSREAMVRRFEEFYLSLMPTQNRETPSRAAERENETFTEGYTWPAS